MFQERVLLLGWMELDSRVILTPCNMVPSQLGPDDGVHLGE